MNIDKVIWGQGTYLTPQHFQQWDRYHENTLKFQLNSIFPLRFGVKSIDIDKEAISNGLFILNNFKGILSDGLAINIPDNDKAPKSRDFKNHFSVSSDLIEVFLGIPSIRSGSPVCMLDGTSNFNTRYEQDFMDITDENTPNNSHNVAVAKKRLNILFSDEELNGYNTIKIAEIKRIQSGVFALREEYIPPSISTSSCEYMKKTVTRVYEKLLSKRNSVISHIKQRGFNLADCNPGDSTNLWFLYSLNSNLPLLKHFYETNNKHPEELYITLSRIVGELMTFSEGFTPKDIHKYDHESLYETFKSLEENLDLLMNNGNKARFVSLPVEKNKENIFASHIRDERLLECNSLYMALSGNLSVENNLEKVSRYIKIGSLNIIDLLISNGMQGIKTTHIANPPSFVPSKLGFQYFKLENFGEYWVDIKESRKIAVHIPKKLLSGNTKVEFIFVNNEKI